MRKVRGYVIVAVGVLVALIARPNARQLKRLSKQPGAANNKSIDSPAKLPASRWKTALKRTKQALKDKQLSMLAAAMAYYATLTFFPALIAAATIYASFTSPQNLLSAIESLKGLVPAAIYELLHTQITPIASSSEKAVGIAAVISIITLLWTTSGGLQNLIKATNITYDTRETRGLIKLRALSLLLSFALLTLGALVLVLLLLQGSALTQLGFPGPLAALFPILRWPLLIIVISIALAIIYRYAPDRHEPRWQWVSWGAVMATIIWLLGTAVFFFYAQHFGKFNKTYGTFAGIVILMTWFNLSSLIILIGAQVNKKLEDVAGSKTTG
jgi:membrane protein